MSCILRFNIVEATLKVATGLFVGGITKRM